MLLMVSAEVPLLVRVTYCEALVDPTFTEPNERLVADRATGEAAVAVPDTPTVCVSGVRLSELSVS